MMPNWTVDGVLYNNMPTGLVVASLDDDDVGMSEFKEVGGGSLSWRRRHMVVPHDFDFLPLNVHTAFTSQSI